MNISIKQLYTDRRAVWTLAALIILALVTYFYCINQTVRNVVARQQLTQELATMQTQVGNMEFRYIDERNDVDQSEATQLGFQSADHSEYITRPALGQRDQTDREL